MPKPPNDLIKIRSIKKEDESFIFKTWTQAFYYGSGIFKHLAHTGILSSGQFFEDYAKIIEKIISKPRTQVWVACLVEDEDVVVGYSVIENMEVLHFVFVKSEWRQNGIAKSLTDQPIKYFTHYTPLGNKIRPDAWVLKPQLI